MDCEKYSSESSSKVIAVTRNLSFISEAVTSGDITAAPFEEDEFSDEASFNCDSDAQKEGEYESECQLFKNEDSSGQKTNS